MTAIRTQRSAVLNLKNIRFEPDPALFDPFTQQPAQGGTCILATDNSSIFISGDILVATNADFWFEATLGSNISLLPSPTPSRLIIDQSVSQPSFSPFYCTNGSNINLRDEFLFQFVNNSGIPSPVLLSGTVVDTNSHLYFNSQYTSDILNDSDELKGSLNNIFYSGGEPYVEINSSGSLPEATGENSIAIGGGTDSTGESSIAIGHSADAEADYGIAIGSTAEVEHIDTIAIGRDASDAALSGTGNILIGAESSAGFATQGIAIGFNSATATRSISIGLNTNTATSPSNDHIAIGTNVEVWEENSIGIGTNSIVDSNSENGIAFGFNTITSADNAIAIGTSAEAGALNNVVIGNGCKVESGGDRDILIGSNIDLEGGEGGDPPDLIIIGSDITIGSGSGSSIVIGKEASTTNVNTIAIGDNSLTDSASSIAIGSNAVADAGAAVQIGQGTNNRTSTLQLFNSTIANEFGIEAPVTTGNNLGSPPAGSIYVDDTNGSERICVYVNGGWKCANLTT